MEKKRQRLSWDDLVEERIRQAHDEGQFTQLPGLGEKCVAIDEPYDELWWVRRFLKREGLAPLPISLEIRRVVEVELSRIAELPSEERVREVVAKLNERIRDANYPRRQWPAVECLSARCRGSRFALARGKRDKVKGQTMRCLADFNTSP